ncbi:septum site-determining protein MinC [Ammonifex degensii KC4]|uniref:Probable septum site-determining protein MinC n=1 Tax=Ammonifex degensii (strain DSM 10501 / KC4) TaxID=429009 RepID=C9RBH4_AMMDK|nr:septum site-determining protein MinC [Ammonifex degensii]ACX51601.1 septum site-determining protein MinC [Ammonifex degensii KC4]
MSRSGISIKGTREGLVIFLDAGYDFEEWKQNLKRHLESARGFFQGARFLLHPRRELPAEQEKEIVELVSQYGLVYLGRRKVVTPLSVRPQPRPSAEANTYLHRSHVRAGQILSTAENLVIMGDVHPGARVEAGGSVIVCGSLRGEVAAGKEGNPSAVIVAYRFAPVRLSIAGVSAPPPPSPLLMVKARLEGKNILLEPLFPH